MNKKKWQIENLNDELKFKSSANIILKNRLARVQKDIKIYLRNDSVEVLHKLRISLRRLRYSMELFISCFEKRKFMILYNKVESLQDLSGSARDFDIMKENLQFLASEEKMKINKKLFRIIDDLRIKCYSDLKKELIKFTRSKPVKSFDAMLTRNLNRRLK